MAWRFGDRGRGPQRPWIVCGRGRGSRNFGVGPWTLVGVGSGRGIRGVNPRPIRYNPPGPSAQAHSQANKCPVRYEVTRTGLGDSQSPVMQRRVFSRGRARRSQQPRAAAGVGIIGILCSWCPCTARGTRRPLRRLVSRFSCPRSHGAV